MASFYTTYCSSFCETKVHIRISQLHSYIKSASRVTADLPSANGSCLTGDKIIWRLRARYSSSFSLRLWSASGSKSWQIYVKVLQNHKTCFFLKENWNSCLIQWNVNNLLPLYYLYHKMLVITRFKFFILNSNLQQVCFLLIFTNSYTFEAVDLNINTTWLVQAKTAKHTNQWLIQNILERWQNVHSTDAKEEYAVG